MNPLQAASQFNHRPGINLILGSRALCPTGGRSSRPLVFPKVYRLLACSELRSSRDRRWRNRFPRPRHAGTHQLARRFNLTLGAGLLAIAG